MGEEDLLAGWNFNVHEGRDTGLGGLGVLSTETVGLGCGYIPK